jgi:hypothetical protein
VARKSTLYAGIVLISAATLLFELALTRVFALIEWYHLAFLSVSVALLGYAASGTWLSLRPQTSARRWPWVALAFPLSIWGAYHAINTIPFDSYQLMWSRRQILYVAIYYLSLVVPFALAGYLLAHWLTASGRQGHRIYAANLIGSGLGSLSLAVAMPTLGGEGATALAGTVGALGAMILLVHSPSRYRRTQCVAAGLLAILGVCMSLFPPAWWHLRLSPYKGLSYALQPAGARQAYQAWNTYSRVDVVESAQIHSAPGLSLNYAGRLPPQHGLTIDGDNLSPLSRRLTAADAAFLNYLPSAFAYRLVPEAKALIIQPRAGLDVAMALQAGAKQIQVVEDNDLVVHVVRDLYGPFSGNLYQDPRVTVQVESGRTALARSAEAFGIIQFSLSESFHPLAVGTYSLGENYLYTIEAVTTALGHLEPGGILVITRWLQDPPSESVRAAALTIAALEQAGIAETGRHLLAYRSWSTLTLIASPTAFSDGAVGELRAFCEELGYDLVFYPNMPRAEANRYNRLPAPLYYDALRRLMDQESRAQALADSLYDISPPSDNRPFFGHHFRPRQIPQIMRQLGRSWQPFGGSGFLLVLLLLIFAILASMILIAIPMVVSGERLPARQASPIVGYFFALGLAFMLIEMPLMQQFILYLGQPAYSFIVVLAGLLIASGSGSIYSQRISLRYALMLLVILALGYPFFLQWLFTRTIGWPLVTRVPLALLCLVPIGFLMGIPFAGGLARLAETRGNLVPWVWAINGGASVIGSILATVLALSRGYRFVLAVAACCYLIALGIYWLPSKGMWRPSGRP